MYFVINELCNTVVVCYRFVSDFVLFSRITNDVWSWCERVEKKLDHSMTAHLIIRLFLIVDVWAKNVEWSWKHYDKKLSGLSACGKILFQSLCRGSVQRQRALMSCRWDQLVTRPTSAAVNRQEVGAASFCTCFCTQIFLYCVFLHFHSPLGKNQEVARTCDSWEVPQQNPRLNISKPPMRH